MIFNPWTEGVFNFGEGALPNPETELFATGFPPLILIVADDLLDALSVPVEAELFTSAGAAAEAPVAPGLPSGEIATRAARFPCGGAIGASGPGMADNAINVAAFSVEDPTRCPPTSGAGPASTAFFSCAIRGAAPALNSSFGRAGVFGGQSLQDLIQRQHVNQVNGAGNRLRLCLIEFDALEAAFAFAGLFGARVINQQAPHLMGSDDEKMHAVLPVYLFVAEQSQEDFVH